MSVQFFHSINLWHISHLEHRFTFHETKTKKMGFPNIFSKLQDPKLRAILCCLIECFMLNHTTTIFSSVEYVLREQGFFSDKSEDQLRILYGRLFTSISICCNIVKILVSLSYDYIGLWIPRIGCHVLQVIGLSFLLIATPETPTIFVWLGYPFFYGGGAGLAYSYFMIIPIFPKRTGLLYGIMGLPVAAAMVWYVALVNMGSWYKVMFVAWLFCIPFSIAHTKVGSGVVILETRGFGVFKGVD